MATLRYLAQTPAGYEERAEEVPGPFFHGSRSRRLVPGTMLTPGHRTNPWGDEGKKSTHIHVTSDPGTAADCARRAGGYVYEVEPVGELKPGYTASEYKTVHPVRVIRLVASTGRQAHLTWHALGSDR